MDLTISAHVLAAICRQNRRCSVPRGAHTFALCAGYAFIQFTGLQHGYWILLTSLFVCQPNYNATRHRLALRIGDIDWRGAWPANSLAGTVA